MDTPSQSSNFAPSKTVPQMLLDSAHGNPPERRIALQDRRAEEWRRSAGRRESDRQPVTALLFRNEAFRIENPEINLKCCDW